MSEPTHLDGALLDHVYASVTYVTSLVNNIYFSDHDAVKVQIRFRRNDQEDINLNISI